MGFLWFIIGAAIGFVVAWYLRGQQCQSEISDREAEITLLRSERDAAKDKTAAALAAPQPAPEPAQPEPEPEPPAADLAGEADVVNDNVLPPAPASKPDAILDAPGLNAEPDDLTRIKGIGQVLQGKLNALGIVSFQQIADFTPGDIARVNDELDFPGRIERERWVEQARSLAEKGGASP